MAFSRIITNTNGDVGGGGHCTSNNDTGFYTFFLLHR